MKEKVKIERYIVHEKHKEYEVLKMPHLENMWIRDSHPGECWIDIDGNLEVYKWLKYSFAILANDPTKIIYFPCKTNPINYNLYQYEFNNSDLVLYRSEFQLRRSYWPRIQRKLNKYNKVSNYVLTYDEEKLNDYYQKGLWFSNGKIPDYKIRKEPYMQTIIEDTSYMCFGRIRYYEFLYTISELMKEVLNGNYYTLSNNYLYKNMVIGFMCEENKNVLNKYKGGI